jgi:hypothetical protein
VRVLTCNERVQAEVQATHLEGMPHVQYARVVCDDLGAYTDEKARADAHRRALDREPVDQVVANDLHEQIEADVDGSVPQDCLGRVAYHENGGGPSARDQ